MSRTDSEDRANNYVENMFPQEIYHTIPKVISQVCAGLRHYPDQTELDDFVQEIIEAMLEDDRRVLFSFDYRSKLQTWLYTIVRRHILHQLQRRSKNERLDDMSLDSSILIVQPDQENGVFAKEVEAILQAAFGRLTGHERKLLDLWLHERSRDEIAKEMGIKKKSVSREINALIKKLRRIIGENYGV